MIEVYCYIPKEEAQNVVECGLKMSKWADREMLLNEEPQNCIAALLNPKDDSVKQKDKSQTCVKLEVAKERCYVGDRALYLMAKNHPEAAGWYQKSIIPIEAYVFGTYRIPECLVTTTVLPGHIHLQDARMDSPILFNHSEEMYTSNIVEEYKDKYDDFYDVLLYYFYCSLEACGKMQRIEDKEQGLAVFVDEETNAKSIVRIPNLWDYI